MSLKYNHNESGAALLIILIVVVIVSIVGTAMLSTTTYGLERVVKTTKEQEEFYRAEGAIEIVLSEMKNYQNDRTGNIGSYYYLLEKRDQEHLFEIGNKKVEVDIKTDPEDLSSITPTTAIQPINVILSAKYKDQSTITRAMNLKINVNSQPLTSTRTAYSYVTPGHFIEKGQFDNGLRDYINEETYKNVLKELSIDWTNWASKNYPALSQTGDYTFPAGTTMHSEIKLSGGKNTITIPKDSIVIAKTVTVGGNGNNETQFVIEGALIAETINHDGNSVFTVNSGLIAKYYEGTSSKFVVKGKGEGISCTLLQPVCTAINGSQGNGKFSSVIIPESFHFSTTR